jgi:RHS repeat-associated protein
VQVPSTQVDGCRGAASYLGKRTVPAAGVAKKCVKTAAYLDRRTLPSPETAAPAGASLTYEYAWNADGSAGSRTRTISAPDGTTDTTSQAYGYDDLARLIESATTDGATSRYEYDAAGNRTSWAEGDHVVRATLDTAGRVTSTSDGASYSYDAAGSRSSAMVDGRATTFAHDAAGRLIGTATADRKTAYLYDGLNRRVDSRDDEAYGADEVTTAWDGRRPVAESSARHGGSSLLRDDVGGALMQSGVSGVSWLLGDARDVTATATSGGVLDDVVSYGDFGTASFATSGWDAAVGYDGQPGDATLGVDEYFARSYDSAVGSWLEADSWRGELDAPQSLNRYAYVTNSPATYADAFGFMHTRFDGGGGSGRSPAVIRSEAQREHTRIVNRVNAHRSTAGQYPVQTLGATDGRYGGPVPRGTVQHPRSRSGGLQSLRHLKTVRGCGPMDWGCRGTMSQIAGERAPTLSAWVRVLSTLTGNLYVTNSLNLTNVMHGLPELRKLSNLPATAVGLGIAWYNGSRECRLAKNGLIVCQAQSNPGGGGTTIGDVFVTTESFAKVMTDDDLLSHEMRHSEQWAGWGNVGFASAYGLSAWSSSVSSGSYACLNYFEIDAGLHEGKYGRTCR